MRHGGRRAPSGQRCSDKARVAVRRATFPRKAAEPGARDKRTALIFTKCALERYGSADAITADGLRACRVAEAGPGSAQAQEVHRWAKNRAENSHLSTRVGDAQVQVDESPAEDRASLRQRPPPPQPRTPPRRPPDLQGTARRALAERSLAASGRVFRMDTFRTAACQREGLPRGQHPSGKVCRSWIADPPSAGWVASDFD